MDIVTLAMAKAYTDSKTSGSGSGGACLPVVELTTEPTLDGAVLTAEEAAACEAAIKASNYVLVSVYSQGMEFPATFIGRVLEGVAIIGKAAFFDGNTSVAIACEDGTWRAMLM